MTRPNPVKGGKGDDKSLSDFDPKEVEMGIRVEMEHTDDRSVAEDIVCDHLSEDPHYYTKLKGAGLADELKEAVLIDIALLEAKKKKEQLISDPFIINSEITSDLANPTLSAENLVNTRLKSMVSHFVKYNYDKVGNISKQKEIIAAARDKISPRPNKLNPQDVNSIILKISANS